MGNEASLRQNIQDLLDGKLKFADDNLPYEQDELSDTTPENHSEYDFIIVGAGSAGCTIASRLSEVENVTILLIEAGGKEYSIMEIPAMAQALWSIDEIGWNYQTESSDKYCLANSTCSLPRGKAIGGTSAVNSFAVTRGNRRDYDQWARETGDRFWSYQSMLRYFKKLENFDPLGMKYDKRYHKNTGPIYVTARRHQLNISDSFIQAAVEMGYSEVDINGPEQLGISYYQTTLFNDERWSANRAYLRPAKDRKNLIITLHSHVHKILIDKVSKKAYGVKYSKNGVIYEVKAKKEIILSAGVINSPQILMLSGVGPQNHLQELNIDLIKAAPVGENFIDHVAYDHRLTFSVNDSSTVEIPNILDPEDSSVRDYINNKSGPLSYGTSVQVMFFANVDDASSSYPNVRISIFPGNTWVKKESIAPPKESFKSYTLVPMVTRPRSRGKILLRSSDPFDKPKIYPNYLHHPHDVRVLIKGIRLAINMSETEALKKHGSQFQRSSSPCDAYGIDSDKYWECELRTYTTPGHHLMGTCRMGRESSKTAVVIGIQGLRVADASITPNNICGHINIPVIAIGEMAADLIKKKYGYK